jgi:murein DD-endopeptidase MepM/ murein hydrolase activator NlpD
MLNLLLPVKDIRINQPFGVNYLDFYKQWGLKGHNGIDFEAYTGCIVTSAHEGIISYAGTDIDGGISVEITNAEIKTIYYHLQKVASNIQKGIKVGGGQLIGYADNTGKYTTGDHLHFGLKLVDKDGNTLNKNNGYGGAIDPSPYFAERYGKDWMKSAAYNRYGRKQTWLAEWTMKFKNPWLHKQLIKRGMNPIWGIEPINALVYGGWDFDSVINPALYDNWGWLTKTEYLNGARSFK